MSETKRFDPKLLWRIIKLALPYPATFGLALVLALVMAPLSTLRPFLIQKMVDEYVFKGDVANMKVMTFVLIVLLFIDFCLILFFNYITSWLGGAVVRDLRNNVFRHITSLKLKYFDTTPVGQSTTRTINDVETINSVFSEGLMNIIVDILTLIFVFSLMFYTHWQLTLVCMCVLPFLLWAAYWFKEAVGKSFQQVRNALTTMNSFLQERISGMRIVQIFNAEQQESKRFKEINHKYTEANLKGIFAYAIFFPIAEILAAASLGLMIWYGAGSVVKGNLTPGVLVAFPVYLNMFFRPIRFLADKFNTLQMGMVAARRVFDLIDDPTFKESSGDIEVEKIKGDIEFDHVHFAYVPNEWVLRDVSFSMKPLQTLAIVGSTGSGKSTIISLLSRFYDIQQGCIRIDGIPIEKYSLPHLRRRIAVVLQEVNLFNGSVLDNITLRDKSISREKAIDAAKTIGAYDFIMALPGGFDYQVMERGATLSMGQRQLISFVRALVFDPDVLVLDEATSSIDPQSEHIIQYAIEKLIDKRTSIIIAHRLSTIRNANSILVLSKGQVVEQGTHEQLLSHADGHYRKLYDMQFQNIDTAVAKSIPT